MKKLFIFFALSAVVMTAGCRKYDDTELRDRVGDLEQRVTTLEELCEQMNTNISSLQTIVTALQNNDYVTAVTPIYEGGKEVGYRIDFTKSASVTIYHGKDGANGTNGKDGQNGKDGANGKDGYTPQIGVKQDTDGIYYWTLDGDWLTDDSGSKIKAEGRDGQNGKDGQNGQNGADGKDGITPQFKIEDGDWYISTDEGLSWQYLGRATGENGRDGQNGKDGQTGADGKDGQNGADGKDGADGDSFFRDVDTSNPDYIVITLADGTEIKLPTWYAFEELKKLCQQMNTNIASLKTMVDAMEAGDYIVSCTPLMEGGKQVGYTITFSKSGTVTIYHGKDGANGKDGKDGQNGQNGTDGTNGKDGHTPKIGVKEFEGVLYWTVDDEFLTDADGNKVRVTGENGKDGQDGQDGQNGKDGENGKDGKDGVDGKDGQNGKDGQDGQNGQNGADGKDGKDGITPQLKIEDGDWWVSTDNGQTWQNLGKATGADDKDGQNGKDGKYGTNGKDGKDGDSFFRSVNTSDPNYVIFTLADGTELKLPRYSALAITFDEAGLVLMLPNSTREIGYTITGNTANLQIEVLSFGNIKAKCTATTETTGKLTITSGPSIDEDNQIFVFVSNDEKTIMRRFDINVDIYIPELMELAFPDPIFRQYVLDNFDTDEDGKISKEEALQVTKIDCQSKSIESLDGVQYFRYLNTLSCYSNQLTSLDVSGCIALTKLECYSNQLTSLDLSKNTALTSLDCHNNQLTSLDVSGCTALTSLRCEINPLTSLDVSQNTALISLWCYSNNLTSLDLSKNTALRTLYCSSNKLTTLDVSKTNLGYNYNYPLDCAPMETLQTLTLKRGWKIDGITLSRSTNYIPSQTKIEYVD